MYAAVPSIAFCTCGSFAAQNAIVGSETAADGQLVAVGQKAIDGYGEVDVYLSVANIDTLDFMTRCRAIQRPQTIKKVVVLTPCPVALSNSQRELLDGRGVTIISLSPTSDLESLVIDWDGQVIGPPRDRTADGVYSPNVIVFQGKEHRCDLTKRELAFMALALRNGEIPLSTLISLGEGALWKQRFSNDKQTRDKVTQFLSRLNKKLARATPPLPFLLSLPRHSSSIRRDADE